MIAFLNWLDGVLWGVPLIALMILTGLYFTVRSGFFQFRHFGWIMKRTGGKLFQKEDKASEGKGMLSSFEAISTAIGGTVDSVISPVLQLQLQQAAREPLCGCGFRLCLV